MYITRAAEPTVRKLSEMFPVLLVTGHHLFHYFLYFL